MKVMKLFVMKVLPYLEHNFIIQKIKILLYRIRECLYMNIHEKCLSILTKVTTWNFYEAAANVSLLSQKCSLFPSLHDATRQ